MNVYDLSFKEFASYVKNIKYGYISKDGVKHLDEFSNPGDNYLLQSPDQLIDSNIGLCFDIVELYRSFLTKKGVVCESYFIAYIDNDIIESHTFMIEKRKNNLWYECIDNSWVNDIHPRGYHDKDLLVKNIYEWFQSYVEESHENVEKSKYYLNKYDSPNIVFENKKSLISFCTNRDYLTTHRTEYSGMAIVFCKEKVLVLETKHNEFVFPKGHIESGETSKDASIRECLEESGISINKGNYYGECGNYSYTFSAGHLKIPSDDYYKTFGVNSITKNIYVHVFEIDEFQHFKLESIFIKGIWVDIKKISTTISHDNTKAIFKKALELYSKKHS